MKNSGKETKALSNTDKKIHDSIKIKIINEARLLFGEYIKHADFCEGNLCEVNMNSVNRFKGLFESNALVVDDLFPGLQSIDVNDYAIGIYNYLQKRGVQYDWKNPDNDDYDFVGEIASIKETKDDFQKTEYYCSLHFVKVMFIRLTKKGKVVELKGKNKIEIPLTIKIVMDENFSNAKIAEISQLKEKRKIITRAGKN